MYHGGLNDLPTQAGAIRRTWRATLWALLCGVAGCGQPSASSVQLSPVPLINSECGRAANAHSLVVTALGDSGADRRIVSLDDGVVAIDLTAFPVDTRQLTIEVLGASGAVTTAGKTAAFDGAGLVDVSAPIALAMLPIEGGCAVGPMVHARDRPQIAAAADGALVIGGGDVSGAAEAAEWYDRASASFHAVTTPTSLDDPAGFIGASVTTMPDGRVVIIGGPRPAYVVFDPAKQRFGAPGLLEARVFHAAVALDDHRVFIAGGCSILDAGQCGVGSSLRSTRVLDIDSGDLTIGPNLLAAHVGGSAWLEAAIAGETTVAIGGGVDDNGAAVATIERVDVAAGAVNSIDGGSGVVAIDRAGAALLAFAPEGADASGQAAVLAGNSGAAYAVASDLPRSGATLTTAEDGSVIALGGDDGTAASTFSAQTGRWQRNAIAGDSLGVLSGAASARLTDGSILVVGGTRAGAATSSAWVYRPSLVGPWTQSLTETPAADDAVTLVPADSSTVERDNGWRLRSPTDGLGAWAVIAGPEFADGAMTLTADLTGSGGVALLCHVAPTVGLAGTTAAWFDDVELVPGAPAVARSYRGTATVVETCRGSSMIDATTLANATLSVSIAGQTLAVSVDGASVIRCTLPASSLPISRGVFGVGAIGADSAVTVETVTVDRTIVP